RNVAIVITFGALVLAIRRTFRRRIRTLLRRRAEVRTLLGRRTEGSHIDYFAFEVLDPLDAGQPLALSEPDQPHTLRVAPENRYLVHRCSNQRAGRADQHDFLTGHDLQRSHGRTIPIGGLQGYHALTAAAVRRKLLQRGQFSVTRGG